MNEINLGDELHDIKHLILCFA